jgi:hypothetical protein
LFWYTWHLFYFPITQIKLLSRHILDQENFWACLCTQSYLVLYTLAWWKFHVPMLSSFLEDLLTRVFWNTLNNSWRGQRSKLDFFSFYLVHIQILIGIFCCIYFIRRKSYENWFIFKNSYDLDLWPSTYFQGQRSRMMFQLVWCLYDLQFWSCNFFW